MRAWERRKHHPSWTSVEIIQVVFVSENISTCYILTYTWIRISAKNKYFLPDFRNICQMILLYGYLICSGEGRVHMKQIMSPLLFKFGSLWNHSIAGFKLEKDVAQASEFFCSSLTLLFISNVLNLSQFSLPHLLAHSFILSRRSKPLK